MTQLTGLRLEAVIEALTMRLAGPIEGEIRRAAYEKALQWAEEEARFRATRTVAMKTEGKRVVPPLTGTFTVSEAYRTDPDAAP